MLQYYNMLTQRLVCNYNAAFCGLFRHKKFIIRQFSITYPYRRFHFPCSKTPSALNADYPVRCIIRNHYCAPRKNSKTFCTNLLAFVTLTASSAAGASCPTALRADGKQYIGAADGIVCGPFQCKGGLYGYNNERAKIPRCRTVRAGLPAYHRARHHPGGQRFQRHKDGKRSHPRSRREENPLRHKQLKYVCNIVRSSRLSA